MVRHKSGEVLLCLLIMFVHQESLAFKSANNTLLIPCEQTHSYFKLPSHTESNVHICSDPYHRWEINEYIRCYAHLRVPDGKYLSLKTRPFEPVSSCRDIGIWLKIDDKIYVQSCDRHTTYHSESKDTKIVVFMSHKSVAFCVTIGVRALDQNGRRKLNVTHDTKMSGTVTPYFFDGFTDHAQCMYAHAVLQPPLGHRVMLSFPHFDIKPMPECIWALLEIQRNSYYGGLLWKHCGNLQLPPKLFAYHTSLWFGFYSNIENGFSGFNIRFSFHNESEVLEQLPTNNATTSVVFNCSVPFYAAFSQHLQCNLETECIQAEDEASCPYRQGACEADFLSAGGRCYKYFRTRKRMTWYDASSVCLKEGLTLASFPTFEKGEAFRKGLLRYAPTTFKTFIGLRTSDSSLPAIYREVWQWSSGIIAYYVGISAQRLFKPTCGSFAAMSREKISTTLCGFYEYMHYIFCETETPGLQNQSDQILFPSEANSSHTLLNRNRFVTCPEGHVMHDFLSCDHASRCIGEPSMKSCVTKSSIKMDSDIESFEVLMYVCDSQTQTIHYTQVCDHQAQCFDSSDESFCSYQECSEKQCLNHQCVTTAQWCDGMTDCSDGSDEACPQFMTVSTKPPVDSTAGFYVISFDGHGGYDFIAQGEEFPVCPPTHFMCANRQLCLPVYLLCNHVYDCSDKEDEDNCESATCPGLYRCRQSEVCVHSDHICDGVFQCPQQDDELLCQLICPDNCLCQGLAFVCSRPFPVQDYSDIRYLDASGSGISPDSFISNHYLVRLSLSQCSVYTLPVFDLPNLKFLYLDRNRLRNVKMNAFLKLSNLNVLSLSGNPIIQMVTSDYNVLLENVHSLDLSHTRLKYFESVMLWNIRNVEYLNISHSMLKVIGGAGFRHLPLIRSLDLRGSDLEVYPVQMLQSVSSLQILFSDVYKLCCQEILPKEFNTQNCHAAPDEIASCKDLLRSDMFRLFLWISCCFALFGNAGSFTAKLYMQKGKRQTSFDVFIAHLNVSDFFMGLYLVLVGSADQFYRGAYLWHEREWKRCVTCKIAGFCSLLSCEMSAFIICFITLDRFLVIRFPFSQVRFNRKSAQMVCGLMWIIGIALAALPLLPVTSHWEFYSQTDICIPLPVTKQNFKGHFYSFGILIVFNFLLFVLIAVGQVFIYVSIRASSMETDQKNERETTVARRLLTVVMSDFLCWFPVGLCGLMASNGVSIPGEVSVIMAIFALPLNSALNPFLYTFNLLMEKRRKASEERLLKMLQARFAA